MASGIHKIKNTPDTVLLSRSIEQQSPKKDLPETIFCTLLPYMVYGSGKHDRRSRTCCSALFDRMSYVIINCHDNPKLYGPAAETA